MTDQELKAIEERAEKAPPGPWRCGELGSGYDPRPDYKITSDALPPGSWIATAEARPGELNDEALPVAEFIAHAREDIPRLLAEVKRLREENAAMKALDACLTTTRRRLADLEATLTRKP